MLGARSLVRTPTVDPRAAAMGATLALLLAIAIARRAHATTMTASRTYPTEGIHDVDVDFPAGQLVVTATDDPQISVTMTARCRDGWRCSEDRIRAIRLISEVRDHSLTMRLERMRTTWNVSPKVKLEVRVPRGLGIEIHMGAGVLAVRSVTGDLHVNVGAGDVSIRTPEPVVRSVAVRVGIGEARLSRGDDPIEGRGFLSKRLDWSSGRGSAHMNVVLGVGDVRVALD